MTVNQAFEVFMKDYVNLDPGVVERARASRDNLLANIKEFDGAEDFFKLYPDIHIQFGSFARKTKCRELDDIDLMIGVSAEGASYSDDRKWNDIRITPSATSAMQKECLDENGYLNSRKVIEAFKRKLSHVREYSRSEVKRNQQAVVLNLISKDWSFDIVPCFLTVQEIDGRNYYLIPNGNGHWLKTDPRKDRDTVTAANRSCEGKLLELIRLVKRWNKKPDAKSIPSYLLETMVVSLVDSSYDILDQALPSRFIYALTQLKELIYEPVDDMKEIQGDINSLKDADRESFAEQCETDLEYAEAAVQWEAQGYIQIALQKWQKVFGNDFPTE